MPPIVVDFLSCSFSSLVRQNFFPLLLLVFFRLLATWFVVLFVCCADMTIQQVLYASIFFALVRSLPFSLPHIKRAHAKKSAAFDKEKINISNQSVDSVRASPHTVVVAKQKSRAIMWSRFKQISVCIYLCRHRRRLNIYITSCTRTLKDRANKTYARQ